MDLERDIMDLERDIEDIGKVVKGSTAGTWGGVSVHVALLPVITAMMFIFLNITTLAENITVNKRTLSIHLTLFLWALVVNSMLFFFHYDAGVSDGRLFYVASDGDEYDAETFLEKITKAFNNSIYYTLTTHTTVGFGDMYPISLVSKFTTALHIGLVCLFSVGALHFSSKD